MAGVKRGLGATLTPDPHGMTGILDAFWVPLDNTARPIAPRLLIYADLIASLDDRNREGAQALLEQLDDIEATARPGY